MDATSPPGGEPNNRLLDYKIDVITKNLEKMELSMKEMNNSIAGLSRKSFMMAGAIALCGFAIPVLIALSRIWR